MGHQTRPANRIRRQDRRSLVRRRQGRQVRRRCQSSERRRSHQEMSLSTFEQLRRRIRRILARPQVSSTRFDKIIIPGKFLECQERAQGRISHNIDKAKC